MSSNKTFSPKSILPNKTFSPKSILPNKTTLSNRKKNTYTLMQFKKLIGKKLVGIYSGVIVDKKNMLLESKKIKDMVMNNQVNQLGLVGYVNESGIFYVLKGVEKLYLICNLSYSEIKKYKIDLEINVVQYHSLTKSEINKLIS